MLFVAYTICKYGMSMCVLGMAEEFKGEVAVNALWPKTGDYFELLCFVLYRWSYLGLIQNTEHFCVFFCDQRCCVGIGFLS